VLHLVEYLAQRRAELGELAQEPAAAGPVVFHDPCRLGRHLGVYDEPRQVLASLPGIELREMAHRRGRAGCCAGGTWSSCDRYSKQIQVELLREARATGAEVLVTACPKCRIHLRCAMNDPTLGDELALELRDVADLAAAALGGPSQHE
jgi:Fe-S oxidoreductase